MELNAPPQAPPPGEAPPPPWRAARLVVPEADASATSQVAVYLVAVYAVGLVSWAIGVLWPGAVLAAALGGGAVVAATVPSVRRHFRHAPGLVLGPILAVGLLVLLGVLTAVTGLGGLFGPVGAMACLAVGAFVVGLDWCDVARLRAVPVLAGLPVVLVSLSDQGPMLVFSLGWLALAVLALWSLECDQRAAYVDVRALGPAGAEEGDVGSRDLAGALLVAMAIGLLFAFSASMPSCSLSLPGTDRISLPSVSEQLDLSRYGFRLDGDLPEIDHEGIPYRLHTTPSGHMILEDLRTGERYPVFQEDDLLVARDRNGEVVAVFRPVDDDPPDDAAPSEPRDWSGPLRVLGVLLAVGALTALAWWWWRRRRPPTAPGSRAWAEQQVRRLDRLGQRHGADRRAAETVACHTRRLAGGPLPDDRLPEVGRLLSDALFGQAPPTMATRLWVEQVIDQVTEAHPAPGRRERRRRAAAPLTGPPPSSGA